jgi:hypothetical protein
MKRTTSVLLAIAMITLLASCGGGETASTDSSEPEKTLVEAPPMDVAAATVSNAPEFSEYKFTRAAYSLPMQASMLKGAALEAAEDLEKAEWVFLDPAGNLILTTKAESDKRFIPRDNGSLDIVPLARKEFVGVDGLGRDDEGDVTIDFTWRWVPNEIATAFTRGGIATRFEGDQKARATIYPARDGSWKVMRIVEIEQEAPEETETTGT